jgi:hypothetical protein
VLVVVVEAAALVAVVFLAYVVSPTIGAMANAAAIARVSPNSNNLDL